MFKKILAKAFGVIRRMNDFWDRDEDKEVSSIVSSIVILLGILILKKPILFTIALVLLTNRVLHRFDMWAKWENSAIIDSDSEIVDISSTDSEFSDPDSVTDSDSDADEKEPSKEDESKD